MFAAECPEARKMGAGDIRSRLDFKSADDFSMPLNQKIRLRSVIRPPIEKTGLALAVMDRPMRFQNDELLKKPSFEHRIEGAG